MLVHFPEREFRYLVFVSKQTELAIMAKLEYDNRLVDAELITDVVAGVYGFNNKEMRDRFIRRINSTSEDEQLAYNIERSK